VEGSAAALLLAVHWLLATHGVYVIISFRDVELLRSIVGWEGFSWMVDDTYDLPPPADVGRAGTLLIVRKRGHGTAISADKKPCLRQHVQVTTDWWYQQEHPLLTAERREDICTAWTLRAMEHAQATCHNSGGETAALPLSVAYEVLFTPLERTELSYEDFSLEIRAALGGGDSKDLSLHSALEFLRGAQ